MYQSKLTWQDLWHLLVRLTELRITGTDMQLLREQKVIHFTLQFFIFELFTNLYWYCCTTAYLRIKKCYIIKTMNQQWEIVLLKVTSQLYGWWDEEVSQLCDGAADQQYVSVQTTNFALNNTRMSFTLLRCLAAFIAHIQHVKAWHTWSISSASCLRGPIHVWNTNQQQKNSSV